MKGNFLGRRRSSLTMFRLDLLYNSFLFNDNTKIRANVELIIINN